MSTVKKSKKPVVEEAQEEAAVEEEVAVAKPKKNKKNKAHAEPAPAAEEEAAPVATEGKKKKKKQAAAEAAAAEAEEEQAPPVSSKKQKKHQAAAAAEDGEEAEAAPPKKEKKPKAAPAPAAEEDDDEVPVPAPKGTKRSAEADESSAKKPKAAEGGSVCGFVTSLSFKATDEEIMAAWEGVESVDIFKEQDGRSKGRGKVYFDTQEHADAAFAAESAEIGGRTAYIRAWTEGGAGAGGGQKRGADGGNSWGDNKRQRFDSSNDNAEPSLTVFVRSLSYNATDADIMKAWKGVSEVDIFKDHEGNSKGSGKVTFESLDAAKKAVEGDSTLIAGRPVSVRYWSASGAGGGRAGGGGGRFGGGRDGGRRGFGGRDGGRRGFGGRDGGRRGFGGRGSTNSTPSGTKTTFGDDSDS